VPEIEVKVRAYHPDAKVPTPFSCGRFLLYAVEPVLLYQHEPTLVRTGLLVDAGPDHWAEVLPLDDLTDAHGVAALNTPCFYQYGEPVTVTLQWSGYRPNYDLPTTGDGIVHHAAYRIERGDPIALLTVWPRIQVHVREIRGYEEQ
jgi:hypothetical protein